MTCRTLAAEKAAPTFTPTYNLFRRKLCPELQCAVPEDRPVPGFLDEAAWEYAGTLRPETPIVPGFDPAAAELGSQLNGFHLFQIADAARAMVPIRVDYPDFAAKPSARIVGRRTERDHGFPGNSAPDHFPVRLLGNPDVLGISYHGTGKAYAK
jgi:hypothetical protein